MNNVGESDSAFDTYVGQLLDMAQKNVASLHPWPELDKRAFITGNTIAPYSTGTVAVTNGDETVTLTGGVFPTAVVTSAYKFALSASGQWYGIATRTDDTHVELAHAYVGTTSTSSTYLVYKDVYGLASDVDKVISVWIHDGTRAVELFEQPSEDWVSEFGHFPSGLGVPTHFCRVERDSSGYVQLRLGPQVPDAAYRVEYAYRKKITEGSFVLDDSRVDLVIHWAQAMAYQRDHFDRYQAMMAAWPGMVAEEIGRSGDVESPEIVVGLGRTLGVNSYLTNLMDHGTVET